MSNNPDRTEWFAKCGWGVFCHWVAQCDAEQPTARTRDGSDVTAEQWNRWADAFDVAGLADQLAGVRAPYFFITLGQNSGHYLAPNSTYDRLVGITPSKCSRRDLIADLYAALAPRGIRLLVYLASGAPNADPVARQRLEWEWGYAGAPPNGWSPNRTGKRLAEFQRKWEAVIREWSQRWGSKVSGWWIDGCYFADEMYRHADEPNFRSFAAALRAGNPDAIIGFNFGTVASIWEDGSGRYVRSLTEEEDYTAGEQDRALPLCPGPWVERNGHRARWHVLTYLGTDWCTGQPRFPTELAVGYTRHVAANGGVVTWDVPILRRGTLPEEYMTQLRAIRDGIQCDRP